MRKIIYGIAFMALAFFPKVALASCSSSMNYTFIDASGSMPGSYLTAATTNSNNQQLLSCARTVNYSQIGPEGIYASQIIPTTSSQATFGGTQTITSNYGFRGSQPGTFATTYPILQWGTNSGGYTGVGIQNNNLYPINGIYPTAWGTYLNDGTRLQATDVSGNEAWSGSLYPANVYSQGVLNGTNLNLSGTANVPVTINLGTSNVASQAPLVYGMSAGGFSTASIGSLNSGSIVGVVPEAFFLATNPSGYGLVGVDHFGTMGIKKDIDVGGNANISGSLQAGSTNITGSAAVSSNLGVSGATTLNTASISTANVNTLDVSGTTNAAVLNNTSGQLKSTLGSSATGNVLPAFTSSGSSGASFHTVLLQGFTGSATACGPSGVTTPCVTVVLPSNLAFSGLGDFSCDMVNEVNSGYQRIKNPTSDYPESSDGRTFYLNSTVASATVSAICTGY